MKRLSHIVIFTGRFDAMKSFYGERIGLRALASKHEDWIAFDTGVTQVALHRREDPQRHGIALRFEVGDLAAAHEAMTARGVAFLDAVKDYPWGRFAEFRDPEDNLVGLLQPGALDATSAQQVDRVVLSCSRFADTVHFYRERVGLKPAVDTDRWVEFDLGGSRLALHPRRRDGDHPPHTEQNVTVVFAAEDLMDWVERMRERDVHFATAPIEEDFGFYAEAADPDGYMVVFREPPPPPSLEEELAEAFEEDDAPHQVAIRKPPQKPSRAGGVIAGLQRRSRREAEELRSEREALRAAAPGPRTLDVVAPRGTGQAGARQKPKTQTDPKRAKAKPAIGSLMESGRQSIAVKQRSVAKRSKSAPLKGAAQRPARAARPPAARPTPQRAAKAAPQRTVKAAAKPAAKRAAKPAAKRAARPAARRTAKAAPKRAVKAAPKRAVKRAVKRAPKRAVKRAVRRK